MKNIQFDSPFEDLGVFVLVIGSFLFFVGLGFIKINEINLTISLTAGTRSRRFSLGRYRDHPLVADCIDRQALAELVLGAPIDILHTYLPDSHPLFNPEIGRQFDMAQCIKQAVSRVDFCGFSIDPTVGNDFWNIEEYNYGAGC